MNFSSRPSAFLLGLQRLIGLILLPVLCQLALPAFELVDNFDERPAGDLVLQDDWSGTTESAAVAADPVNSGNQAMELITNSGILSRPLLVPDNGVHMLFCRMRVTNQQKFSVGLSPLATPVEFNDFGPEIGMANETETLRAWENVQNRYVDLVDLQDEVWYNIWVMVDTDQNRYRVWLHDRPLDDATEADAVSAGGLFEFGFRSGSATDLRTIYIKTGGGSGQSALSSGPVWIDDFYFDQDTDGVNLANPTFEPDTDVPVADLMAYYPFAGNAVDAGPFGMDGIRFGTTATNDPICRPFRALQLNGVDERVEVPGFSPAPAAGTLALWVLPNAPTRDAHVISQAGLEIGLVSGRWDCSIERGAIEILGPEAVAGKWTHVAVSWDQTSWTLYIDGVATTIAKSEPASNQGEILVGRCSDGTGLFEGRVDEFLVYSRALDPAEVTDLAAGFPAAQTRPVIESSTASATGLEIKWTPYLRPLELEHSHDLVMWSPLDGGVLVDCIWRGTVPNESPLFFRLVEK